MSKIQKYLAGASFHGKNEHLVNFKDQSASFKSLKLQKNLTGARFLTKMNISEVIKCHFQVSLIQKFISGIRFAYKINI